MRIQKIDKKLEGRTGRKANIFATNIACMQDFDNFILNQG